MAAPEGSDFLRTISAYPDKPVHVYWRSSSAVAGCALSTGVGITMRWRPGPGPERAGKGDKDDSKNVLCVIFDWMSGNMLKVSSDKGRIERQSSPSVI